MMKVFFILILTFLTLGFSTLKCLAQEPRPLVALIENLDMAKNILKPLNHQLMVTRDPFKPIIVAPKPLSQLNLKKKKIKKPEDLLKDVELQGVVRLESECRASIMVGPLSRIVNVGDKIRKYTITKIDLGFMVLSNGKRVITIKRGLS